MSTLDPVIQKSQRLAEEAEKLSQQLAQITLETNQVVEQVAGQATGVDPFVFGLTIFVLACFVGYFVVWRVTPALHTPLMAVTNAISSIIIVGAIIAMGPEASGGATFLGFAAAFMAAINIFGGFVVTQRMLAMFKSKSEG